MKTTKDVLMTAFIVVTAPLWICLIAILLGGMAILGMIENVYDWVKEKNEKRGSITQGIPGTNKFTLGNLEISEMGTEHYWIRNKDLEGMSIQKKVFDKELDDLFNKLF